jgi:hypothetical protein
MQAGKEEPRKSIFRSLMVQKINLQFFHENDCFLPQKQKTSLKMIARFDQVDKHQIK